ncbi:MAG: hypothetical protein LBR52_04225 [Prevotellaceae bacterium]|jgi:hypothetical protein|nr:hypothetical protein [Prevotellaceae bacterium]
MNFNADGVLDSGIHKMTWEEFYDFFSFSPRRKELLEGLQKVVVILREIGATHIYVDGSFVTSKEEPGDWDACFDCLSAKAANSLFCKYPFTDRNAQKELYKGELFFSKHEADEFGHTFLEYFQQRKENHATKKGIVELIN